MTKDVSVTATVGSAPERAGLRTGCCWSSSHQTSNGASCVQYVEASWHRRCLTPQRRVRDSESFYIDEPDRARGARRLVAHPARRHRAAASPRFRPRDAERPSRSLDGGGRRPPSSAACAEDRSAARNAAEARDRPTADDEAGCRTAPRAACTGRAAGIDDRGYGFESAERGRRCAVCRQRRNGDRTAGTRRRRSRSARAATATPATSASARGRRTGGRSLREEPATHVSAARAQAGLAGTRAAQSARAPERATRKRAGANVERSHDARRRRRRRREGLDVRARKARRRRRRRLGDGPHRFSPRVNRE